MREEPIDVEFSEVKKKKGRSWYEDAYLVEMLINYAGGLALFGFVFFALNYGR
jgi:hypothetical protein